MAKVYMMYIITVFLVIAVGYIRCDESPLSGARGNVSATASLDLRKFKCKNGYQEIDVYKRGDGNTDCHDNSDEDADRTGNHTILYFVYVDKTKKKNFVKGEYVGNNSAKGEFQVEIPPCSNEYGWKIIYADKSHIQLRCFENDKFIIMSVTRDGSSRKFNNFTLESNEVGDLLGFLTNSSTGKPVAYFKYKKPPSTLIKVCSEEDRVVENCPYLKENVSRQPEYLIFSPKNNGTLFWLEKEDKRRAFVVKYSINTTHATNIGPELKQPNHLTKDAATNRLYVQILADNGFWIQSFNINGEQSKKVKEIEEEEKKQFAVHNNILYWLAQDKKSIFSCNTSRFDCEKTRSPLHLHINVTSDKYEIKDTIYVYDYQTNLEETVHVAHSILDRPNTLVMYAIIGMLIATLLFVILAYVMGKKKGERTQSMDIHGDIITGTLKKKPAYCEESLLSKCNDSNEKAES